DGRLMAMAGERMRMDGLTEVSAVCTWPEFRGRGLAATLVSFVAAQIAREGRTPFLHVKQENAGAKSIYERLGFRICRQIIFRLVKRL
ncbi:GNAT family N-acetyltransferase, partial [Devosia sp.]|uniref:GNAT family N-acetyltransferase n=1 Tax=Devosia sp. TaxID=1871048 RepID=UPI001ACC6B1A